MRRILYGFSPIGLGHATRALVLSEELRKSGADVKLFSGGKAADFVRGQGLPVESIVDDTGPTVVNGEMRGIAWWYVTSWLGFRRTLRRTERLLDAYDPDLVLCDEEFTGITAAERRRKKRVFMSDELMLGFGRTWFARKIEGIVERWYRNLQDTVDLLVIPEFGKDSGNRRYVGPIVRSPTATCPEVRKKYGLPPGRIILFSMSGSGIGGELALKVREAVQEAGLDNAYLVVSGNRGARLTGNGLFDIGLVADNQNLVACSDLVVSTAGKGTIDEAAASGTPIVVIPIRYHAEQERNARALGYSYEDSGRLAQFVREKLGRREQPVVFRGAEAASSLIMSLL